MGNKANKTYKTKTMTPKEKAIELVNKFYDLDDTLGYGRNYEHGIVFSTEILKRQSKQCALIAVDEIIDLSDNGNYLITGEYWEEVKSEIENL